MDSVGGDVESGETDCEPRMHIIADLSNEKGYSNHACS